MITADQMQQIRDYVRNYLTESAATSTQPWVKAFPRAAEHRWHHTLNVFKNAEAILAGEGAAPDSAEVVRVAVYLHDVSMFVCDHTVHGQVSADMAERYLLGMGLQPRFVARVKRAIAEHGTDLGDIPPEEQGKQFSWEGKVVLEADILDKVGAMAVASGLLMLGTKGTLQHEARAEFLGSMTMERAVFFKDYVWTHTGRRLAEQRFGFLLNFLDQLKEETHDDESAGR